MEYQILNFDRTNILLIKKRLDFIRKEFSYASFQTWNEMSGFYEDKSFPDLEHDLTKTEKDYTGLDQIEVYYENKNMVLNIVFHEDLCWLNIDEKIKSKIENDLYINLKQFKK